MALGQAWISSINSSVSPGVLFKHYFQIGIDTSGIKYSVKNTIPGRVTFQVHNRNTGKVILVEFFDRVSLANLPFLG